RGVVLRAVQQNLIDRRADLSLRCLDQAKSQVSAGVLNPVEVSCEVAIWSQHHDARRVKVLFGLRIVVVSKADRLRQLANRRLVTGQKMPASAGVRPAIKPDIDGFLCGSKRRFFGGIKTDSHD